jgi:hypothetical protein
MAEKFPVTHRQLPEKTNIATQLLYQRTRKIVSLQYAYIGSLTQITAKNGTNVRTFVSVLVINQLNASSGK